MLFLITIADIFLTFISMTLLFMQRDALASVLEIAKESKQKIRKDAFSEGYTKGILEQVRRQREEYSRENKDVVLELRRPNQIFGGDAG